MKKIFILIFAFIIIVQNLFSQDEEFYNYPLSLGPYLAFKAGINGGNIPMGRKNDYKINYLPDFGISSYIPLSETTSLGLVLNLGYSTYCYNIIRYKDDTTFSFRYSYLAFSSNVHFLGFILGLKFGVPISADFGPKIEISKLNTLLEVNLAWMYNLYATERGDLNIYIEGGYMLNGIYNNFANDDPLKNLIPAEPPEEITNRFNPRVVSLAIGLKYLFSL